MLAADLTLLPPLPRHHTPARPRSHPPRTLQRKIQTAVPWHRSCHVVPPGAASTVPFRHPGLHRFRSCSSSPAYTALRHVHARQPFRTSPQRPRHPRCRRLHNSTHRSYTVRFHYPVLPPCKTIAGRFLCPLPRRNSMYRWHTEHPKVPAPPLVQTSPGLCRYPHRHPHRPGSKCQGQTAHRRCSALPIFPANIPPLRNPA